MNDDQCTGRPLSEFTQCRYLAYPHTNGFADGGRRIVLGQRDVESYSLWLCDLSTSQESKLCEWPRASSQDNEMLWFDVASQANVLVTIAHNTIWCIDLNNSAPCPRAVYRESDPLASLLALPSIAANGARIIASRRMGDCYQLIEIEVDSNEPPRLLFESQWFANHGQISPHDQRWIGFAHEGATEQIGDRVWGWHRDLAPEGMCLFDNGARGLSIGHERWAFHATSLFAVAYGVSPEGPRGIYEVFPGERTSRLVSEGDRDWHVNASQDGRWLVVDTTGAYNEPGRGWDNAGRTSDVLVIDTENGERAFVGRSRFAAQFHLHPHPTFSPDGRTIVFNEASLDGLEHRVMEYKNPLQH